MAGRISTVALEIARQGQPSGKISTVVLEVARRGQPAGRISAIALEVAWVEEDRVFSGQAECSGRFEGQLGTPDIEAEFAGEAEASGLFESEHIEALHFDSQAECSGVFQPEGWESTAEAEGWFNPLIVHGKVEWYGNAETSGVINLFFGVGWNCVTGDGELPAGGGAGGGGGGPRNYAF